MIIRALGPSLAEGGVNGFLADPTLELHDSEGNTIGFDDNWADDPGQKAQIAAAHLQPSDVKEAAFAATLSPGSYTAVVRGNNDGTGVALVEVYRLP